MIAWFVFMIWGQPVVVQGPMPITQCIVKGEIARAEAHEFTWLGSKVAKGDISTVCLSKPIQPVKIEKGSRA